MKIRINNKDFSYLVSATVSQSFNAVASTFNITVLNKVISELLNYDKIEIFDDNNEILLTGTLLNPTIQSSAKPNSESFNGYSLTGILEDCSIPSFPLQSDNLTLNEIASKILGAMNVEFEIDSSVSAEMDKKYTKTTAQPTDTIISYLKSLAAQRSIIISHTTTGKLLFTRLDPSKLTPVAKFENVGITSISMAVNAQAMHSDITVMRQASTSNPDSGQSSISNPYVTSIYRPITRVLSSGDLFDTEKAARMELAKELANIKISVISTKYVAPGQLVQIKDDNLRITELTDFFVESVTSEFSTSKTVYTLTCVVKDVYDLDNYDIKKIW